MNVIKLQKIRSKLAATRKTAEEALTKAKRVEHATMLADKQINHLKHKACGEVKKLEAKLIKAKKNKATIEIELQKARKACKKAVTTLASARLALNKQAKAVAIAAHDAQRLEAKYAKQDERTAANAANAAARKSATVSNTLGIEHEKLDSINAMIKHAKGKAAEAFLMARAAKKTKNSSALQTADAASEAAKTQLSRLALEKKKVEATIVGHSKLLGELRATIKSDAQAIKHDEVNASHRHTQLSVEEANALKESMGTRMQERVDALTVQLAKETRLRKHAEKVNLKQRASRESEVASLRAKLHAADAAAVAVISHIKKFIGSVDPHDDSSVKKDLKIAGEQMRQLRKLEQEANRQASRAQSKMKLAKASLIPKAARIAHSLLAKAKHDLAAVRRAMHKVQNRANKDRDKLRDDNGKATNSKIREFANSVISKWEHVHKLAFQEQRPTPSAHKTEVLERRIAALEAALRAAGGEVSQMEGAKMAATVSRINKEIAVATKKLKLMKEKTAILYKIEASAGKEGDKSAQIKAGAEERDLSVRIDEVKNHLQELYKKLAAAKAEQNAPDTKTALLPAAHTKTKAKKPAYSLVRKKLANVKKATAAAKGAGKEMERARTALKTAAEKERQKVKDASKAKKELVAAKEKTEKRLVVKMKTDLKKEQGALRKEQETSKKRQTQLTQKLQADKKAISDLIRKP